MANCVQDPGRLRDMAAAIKNKELSPSDLVQRYLDRAAFKAGQEGSVVMIGHTYDETVKGLFSWALEGKGEGIQLAPISAVLTDQ